MDTERVCLALDVEHDEMVDVTRREAARLLRLAAELLEDPSVDGRIAIDAAHNAGRWLVLAELFMAGAEVDGGDPETETNRATAIAQRTRDEDWAA
jgi:hypothetical protein